MQLEESPSLKTGIVPANLQISGTTPIDKNDKTHDDKVEKIAKLTKQFVMWNKNSQLQKLSQSCPNKKCNKIFGWRRLCCWRVNKWKRKTLKGNKIIMWL